MQLFHASNNPPIDTTILDIMRDALGEDFLALIPAYLESATALLAALPGAVTTDRNEALRLAHSLKSSSQNVGATELSSQAKAMEESLRSGNEQDLSYEVGIMQQEFVRVREELEGI